MNFVFRSNRALVFSASLAALLYVVNFFSGHLLSIVFVIPGLSGIVTGFTVPLILVISFLVTRRCGAITVVWTLYSAAAIPTALMGPPGLYKVIIGFSAGVVFDFIIFVAKGRRVSLYLGFIAYTAVMLAEFLTLLLVLDLPGFDVAVKAVIAITVVFMLEGLIAVFVGERVSSRLIRIGVLQDVRETDG